MKSLDATILGQLLNSNISTYNVFTILGQCMSFNNSIQKNLHIPQQVNTTICMIVLLRNLANKQWQWYQAPPNIAPPSIVINLWHLKNILSQISLQQPMMRLPSLYYLLYTFKIGYQI
jgi:hypothetical protein